MMSYKEQLETSEWKEKRNAILQRDKYHCQHCNKSGICGDDIFIPLRTLDDIRNYITDKELQKLVYDSFFHLNCVSGTYDSYGRPIIDEKKLETEKTFFYPNTVDNKTQIKGTDFNVILINSNNWLQKHPSWTNPLLYNMGGTILNQAEDYILWKNEEKSSFPISGRKILINPYSYICSYEVKHKDKQRSGFLKMTTTAIHILFNNICIDDDYIEDSTYFYTNLCKQEYDMPILHVHHKSYKENHLAWEYENSNLITLCEDCHQKEHYQNHISKTHTNSINANNRSSIYQKYLTFFLNNIDFAQIYLSIHYPFSYQFLINNWHYLKLGDAHYSVFMSDIDTLYRPKLGLVFNKNIRWNSKLRAKFDYGLWNPFLGVYEGTDHGQTEHDEIDFEDIMIPLDLKREFETLDHCIFFEMAYLWQELDDMPVLYSEQNLFEEIPFLNFEEFKDKFKDSSLKVLVNGSIWENTLKHIIDEKFCIAIFEKLKTI